MIKALEFRFGSASARSLIYLMSGIVVLLGGAALAFFYWQTSEFRKIETLANGYHLTTLDACASIKEELFLLEKASDQKNPPQGNGLVLPNQINSSAHIIEQRTDHILLLQDTFRQPEFQATVRRLEARTRQLLRLVAAGEAGGEIAPALLQKEVASLQVVTDQLQRLHAASYKESAAHLTTQEYANTRNLFIFVGVLLAVGFLVIWRIVVVTAAKGSKGKEYAPTVVLAIFLAGGIFLLDLLAPLGVAGAVPYVALVLVSLSLPHRKHTQAAATLASVLTVLGFFFSPAGGTLWVVLANRSLALFAIWVTATLGLLHKQAEQALRQSEASLAGAQRISHLGSWQWNPSDGSVLGSAELYRIFGFDPERTPSDYDTFMDRIHPKDRTALEQVLNDAVQEKKPFSMEYRINRPDGSVRIVLSQGEHMPVKKDQPSWMVGTVQDITERKRAEQALRQQAQVIDQIHDSVVSTDLDDYITSWNKGAEKLYGYRAEEVLGKHISLVYLDRDRQLSQKQLIDPLLELEEGGLEVQRRRKSGELFDIHLSLSLLHDDKGTPIGRIGYSLDITERKRAEEQIKTSLREKEVLLQEVHHRVKNNLQVIVSLLNLQAARVTDRQAREMFTESRSRVRAIALMHETLYQSKDLSRIDFGEYSHTLAANLFASYGVDPEVISWRINVENGFLGVDTAIPCGLIVSELISNSLKYAFPAGKHGEICIDFRRDDGNKCILVVKDNGIGLPKEFDLRKLESLGLQLVCTLTDQLDGSLELDCTEGTEFRITFAAGRTTERDTDNGQRTNPGS